MAVYLILAGFFPLSIPVSEFSPGRHNVRVLRREEGQPIPDEIIGGTSLNIERMLILIFIIFHAVNLLTPLEPEPCMSPNVVPI